MTIKAVGEHVHVLSHLLAKNPANLYERANKEHLVRMFFSKFSEFEVEVTVFVTPDPLALKKSNESHDITHYINDREFVVSSIFTSFIRSALATALNGKPKEEYSDWVDHPFDLSFSFGPVSTELDMDTIRSLFEPLGYHVNIEIEEPDYTFSLEKQSPVIYITVSGKVTLQKGLQQLFILIPLLDNYKHYYIDEREIEKLQRYGEGWLDLHPNRDFIIRKSLRFKELYKQLGVEDNQEIGFKKPLNEVRYEKIVEKVKSLPNRKKIVDFGSGEGKLSGKLGFVEGVEEILAVEPSELETAKAVKRFERLKEEKGFVEPTTIWGSLFYFDERLQGKDIMILCEVIEHIDEERLPKIMDLILNQYQPDSLIITTPNREYNDVYGMEEDRRHEDHRFEWTREQFQQWCLNVKTDAYTVHFEGIGDEDSEKGSPTQMCTFSRKEVQG